MLKTAAAAAIALVVASFPSIYAQTATPGTAEKPKASDPAASTDVRTEIVKAALQLTADQEKLWPPIENAVRARAKNREDRLASAMERAEERRNRGPLEALCDRDPVAFMHRRADGLAQRSADLKKLADAWQPLYQTLSSDQKRRLGLLTLFVLSDLRGAEQPRLRGRDSEE